MVPIEKFGRDHWSTFAYLETRVVDHRGVPNREHMRVDPKRHPAMKNSACRAEWGRQQRLPNTRLRGNEPLPDHDDWDCLEDLEVAGLLKNVGTGVNPVVQLTERGQAVATQLRVFKAAGGQFANFQVEV